tara:strand:+ start:919 stop:1917 length:999 start_codon:yes stop_codon:yes gene_type:complete
MNLALVGHGSIGSKFKESILRDFVDIKNLYIIETNKKVIKDLITKGLNCYESLEELEDNKITISYGIVANWGPDHLKTANKLIDLGCKKLIIEKPLSSRKDELQEFIKRCSKEGIFVTVHHKWNFTNIVEIIKNIQSNYNLGNPIGIRLIGGAVCFSTNGTHAFGLSCKLLDSHPKTITADLEIDYINPRGKDLAYIGGMASYKMQNNTFIHASFTNSNSQSLTIECVYRNSSIQFSSDNSIKLFKRDEEEIKKYENKITRYGSLKLIKEVKFESTPTVKQILSNLIYDEYPKVSLKEAEIPVLMVIGALESHLKKKKIDYDNIEDTGVLIS